MTDLDLFEPLGGPATRAASSSDYRYFDSLRETQSMTRFGNLDVLTDPATGEEIQLCHLVGLSAFTQPDGEAFDWTFKGASAIEMAIHHFNTGDGSVVPAFQDIHKKCPIRLTSEWLDTTGGAFPALRTLTGIVTRKENENKPCVIMGSTYSGVTIQTSTLSSVHGFPSMSWVSGSSDLDVRAARPFFSRTMVSTSAVARAAIHYLHGMLEYEHISVLYINDNFGNAFLRSFAGAASTSGIETNLIPFDVEMSPEQTAEVIGKLKDSEFRCVFVIITSRPQLETLLIEGLEQGVVGDGYFWLTGNDNIGPRGVDYLKESQLAKAVEGVGQLELSFGRPENWNYDNLQDQWKTMTRENMEYFDSKYKFDSTNTSLFEFIKPGQVNDEATYSYDALAAVAMAACNVSMNLAQQMGTFSGERHSEAIRTGEQFEGTYGYVAFDHETGTRLATSVEFIVTNIRKSNTTSANDTMYTFFPEQSTILSPNGAGGWTADIEKEFVYFDGSTVRPLDLPELNGGRGEDKNYIGSLRAMGYTLFALSLTASMFFGWWMFKNRAVRVVRVSQPMFLAMILSGSAIMAASIIPRSVDDEKSSTTACNIACMAFPWLLSTGFATVFSALFSKTLRINKILNGATSFRRIKVEAKDVMLPFAILLSLNMLVLICWTAIAPLKYIRTSNAGTDNFNRVIASVGECASDTDGPGSVPFVISLLIINISAVLGANYQAYKARNVQTDFSESKYVAITMLCILEIFIVGIPLYILIEDDPQTSYVLDILIVFITSMAVSTIIFTPKIWFAWQQQLEQKEKDKTKKIRRKNTEDAMASYISDISSHSTFEEEEGDSMGVYLAPSVFKKSGLVRNSEAKSNNNAVPVVPKPAIKAPRILSSDDEPIRKASIVKWKTDDDVADFGEA